METKQKGNKASMKRIRRFMRKTGNTDMLEVGEAEVHRKLMEEFKGYREIRKKAPEERVGFLESLAKAKAIRNETTKEAELKKLMTSERQRIQA